MAVARLFHAASEAFQRGDTAQGLAVVRDAVAERNDREDVSIRAAQLLLRFGLAVEAMSLLETALAKSPDSVGLVDALVAASADALNDADIKAGLSQIITRLPNHARMLGRLGQRLLMQGHLLEATEALERASALNCDEPETYVALGLASFHTNRKPQAVAALQTAIKLKPDNHEAAHMLASFTGANISAASPAYIEGFFNNFAARFDTQLVEKLQYRTPQDVVDLLRSVRPDGDAFDNFLDVGCGTGLIAEALKSHYRIRQNVGVDISRKMLEVAISKNLYESVVHGDATEILHEMNVAFDLIAAIEVPIYLGDLWSLTAAVAERLKPGGLYTYSIETMESGTYKLLPTQRFAHTVWYVENIASSFGLKPLAGRHVKIRLEVDTPVAGYVGVLIKSGAPE
jgi:predicted TPR repeat methyltransferase